MVVRATVLCENTVFGIDGALAEHGWSAWLETPSGRRLARGRPAHPARIRRGRGAHLRPPGSLQARFLRAQGVSSLSALLLTRGVLETAGARFDLAPTWREIAPGVALTGEVPRRTDFEPGDQTLKHYDAAGNVAVDPIRDDQTVVIDTPDDLFVVLGCSHAGLINILTYITEQTGVSRFHTVMGGTHLGLVDQAQADATIAALHNFDIGQLGAAHCTGPHVANRLVQEFGDRFFHCSVGLTVEA